MAFTLTAICALVLLVVLWIKRTKDRHEMEQHSITPEGLHSLLASNQDVLVFDIRQPLDFLANSEIIPGALRLSPKEVLENPSLIPKEKDSVVTVHARVIKPSALSCIELLPCISYESGFSKEAWRAGKPWDIRSSQTKDPSTWTPPRSFHIRDFWHTSWPQHRIQGVMHRFPLAGERKVAM